MPANFACLSRYFSLPITCKHMHMHKQVLLLSAVQENFRNTEEENAKTFVEHQAKVFQFFPLEAPREIEDNIILLLAHVKSRY